MIFGSIIGVAKADTRSFDYSSCKACGEKGLRDWSRVWDQDSRLELSRIPNFQDP